MFVENAQQFSADQVNALAAIVGALILSNAGQLFSWVIRSFRKKIREENDIKAAHDKIRKLEKDVLELKNQKGDFK